MERELIKRKKRGFLWRDESGQVLVLVALGAVFLIGMVALVVDVGHGLVVRNELQNAADASALAGAGNLFINTPPAPNWGWAEGVALSSIAWNKSDGQSLRDLFENRAAYWNLPNRTLGSQTTHGVQDVPAVKVTVRKAGVENGGEVSTWFARIFGKNSFPVEATAVAAVLSGPAFLPPGTSVMPLAISRGTSDVWYGHTDSAHRIDIMSAVGAPPNQLDGQLSTLNQNIGPSVPAIQNLITTLHTTGTTQQINVSTLVTCPQNWNNTNNGCIYIDPGARPQPVWAHLADFVGHDVFLPVVTGNLSGPGYSNPHWLPVVGFVGFHIDSVGPVHGNTSAVWGWFLPGLEVPPGGGPVPGDVAWTAPHLVL
jgi:hypothetical protein